MHRGGYLGTLSFAARASLLNISDQFCPFRDVIPDGLAHIHFLRTVDPISNVVFLIGNCYQYQASCPGKQQAMLDLITAIKMRWESQTHHTILAGDWNASLSPRQGYSGSADITRADDTLQLWYQRQHLLPSIPNSYTWSSADGSRKATLDCFFSRTARNQNSVQNPVAFPMDDPRLDHWAVSVQLVDSRINPMPALEDLRHPVRL